MRTVAYANPFVPAEWIAAHGLRPYRCAPDSAPAIRTSQGACCFARAFAESLPAEEPPAAAVFTTTCDQMRRAMELQQTEGPVFLMNVPATWQSMAAQSQYNAEIARLGIFLESLGGTAPADAALSETMLGYEDARSRLAEGRPKLSARTYAEALQGLYRDGPVISFAGESNSFSGVPIALVGGPLMPSHFGLLDQIEAWGGRITLNATGQGERTLPGAFDPELVARKPREALVRAYFDAIPDAFRRPNTLLYEWLSTEIRRRAVRGILFHSYVWCDLWRAETQRMAENFGLPVLAITQGEEAVSDARTATRVQAFLEALQ